jgi:hypothetical protein
MHGLETAPIERRAEPPITGDQLRSSTAGFPMPGFVSFISLFDGMLQLMSSASTRPM